MLHIAALDEVLRVQHTEAAPSAKPSSKARRIIDDDDDDDEAEAEVVDVVDEVKAATPAKRYIVRPYWRCLAG
jgi:hypothetical protein